MKRIPLFVSAILVLALAGAAQAQNTFKLGVLGGGVVTPDTKTLIVSVPSAGTLHYFDTEDEKEIKKVECDFKPLSLAVQGNKLFAGRQGAAAVHVLELATGKELKVIKVPGEPIKELACHPTKGLLYATTTADEVYAIDAESGKATKTKARGQKILVDPGEGKFVYTGVQKPITDQLVIQEGPNKELKISLATANERAMMLKFAVEGDNLKLVAAQDNAALNGRGMAISPDGKKIAMAGGGGWVSTTERRFRYGIAVFETDDLKTMAGEIEVGAYPYTVAFHPVLNQGVACKSGAELIFFNAKSLAGKGKVKASDGEPSLPLYCAKGTKLVYLTGVSGVHSKESEIQFYPLELSDEDKAKLKEAYK